MKFTKFCDSYFQSATTLRQRKWLPGLNELQDCGIRFQQIDQKPGEMVYVGYGVIHWVLAPVSTFFNKAYMI